MILTFVVCSVLTCTVQLTLCYFFIVSCNFFLKHHVYVTSYQQKLETYKS